MMKRIIAVTLVLVFMAAMLPGSYAEDITPQDVKVVNLGDVKFSVTWITDEVAGGYVIWGSTPDNLAHKAYDVRGGSYVGYTHYADVVNLNPETTYYYRIMTASDMDPYPDTPAPLQVQTLDFVSSPFAGGGPFSVYGHVANSVGPESNALVFCTVENGAGDVSLELATNTSVEGYWSINLGNARDANGDAFDRDNNSKVHITVDASPNGKDTYQQPLGVSPQNVGTKTFYLPFSLSNGAVSPASGDTNTEFTFSLTYTSTTNDAPDSVKVWIDGEAQEMTAAKSTDTDLTDGKVYELETTLARGDHDYWFGVKADPYDVSTRYSGVNEGTLTVIQATDDGSGDTDTLVLAIAALIIIVIIVLLVVPMMRGKPDVKGGEQEKEKEQEKEREKQKEKGEEKEEGDG